MDIVVWWSRKARPSICPCSRRKSCWLGLKETSGRPPHLYLSKATSHVSARFHATQKTQQPAFSQEVGEASGRMELVVWRPSHCKSRSLGGTRTKPDSRAKSFFSCNLNYPPHAGRRTWGGHMCKDAVTASAGCPHSLSGGFILPVRPRSGNHRKLSSYHRNTASHHMTTVALVKGSLK